MQTVTIHEPGSTVWYAAPGSPAEPKFGKVRNVVMTEYQPVLTHEVRFEDGSIAHTTADNLFFRKVDAVSRQVAALRQGVKDANEALQEARRALSEAEATLTALPQPGDCRCDVGGDCTCPADLALKAHADTAAS